MHAIVASTLDAPPGVIFVLKNINNEINVDQQNRLHPFYMVYIGQDGSTVCDYLSPKELLDRLRLLCKGKTEPDQSLCQQFNQATDDGKNMSAYSELLSEAINSILDAKEESDIDSLFKMGGTTALLSSISGLMRLSSPVEVMTVSFIRVSTRPFRLMYSSKSTSGQKLTNWMQRF